jgi:hypothetical protein
MSRNGSGTYSLPVGNPVVTGTTISSTWANNTLTDIANALTGSLAADGQTTASGNLNMGTNKIINLADPTNAQDGATKYYVDQLIAALGTMAYQNANNVAITGGAVSNVALDLHAQTGQMYLPVGPTALRTATPIAGLMRWNTDGGGFYEGYNGSAWQKFTTVNEGSYTITYVIVAGGGGGGTNAGGGGGGGGVISNTLTAIPGTLFSMTIGAGGAGGSNGSNSFITGIATATGGGAGGTNGPASGSAGGSGGGGSSNGSTSGGTGTPGQGNNGGGSASNGAGGGGGAGGAGASGSYPTGGAGGAGATLTITGTTTYAAGGGGGAVEYYQSGSGGAGGIGGGGGGGATGVNGTNGTINTGGGGGGGGAGPTVAGGSGGSGQVYLSMPTANYTGTVTGLPTVTTSGANTIVRFTTSGTYSA